MGLPRDVSPYGSQTVMGPGWPNVEEEQLASAAAEYTQFATKLTGSVVPLQQSQLQALAAQWTGVGSVAASGEATSIIAGHEANAAHAAAIALKLQTMEASVAKTKALVNATAEEVQQECMAIEAGAALVGNAEALIQSRIKMGLSQNIAYVTEGAAEMANGLGVPPSMPSTGAPPGTAQASQAASKGSEQMMQMMMQMGQMAMQLPQQLMQAPQQLMQQVSQPLQQLTSMFGGKGGSSGGLGGASPFPAFSNHPLAGGSGAGGGGGLVKAASLPGAGGSPAQTALMSNLVGTSDVAVRPAGAGTGAVGGVAPVGAGMGGGMAGGMGQRGESGGGHATSLAQPPALEYDLGDEVDDDW
ncbi:hypothetical protein [Mycobacterium sp. AZCC_0083]|uniref:hypothetical protein n=1 Tax=Mycobacterium sp. AZCC_0083 TaxID=2735882 RepID=UPI00161CD17C|nr:hypothetical protein [Mycobacterium sp. AZCC_0083]MBB5165311.1 hypothetical protein [Mycobacterium sp. AZCC_0083]